ncbi:MAG: DNA-3-methyladenine glycosylase I, partial [Candidatus Hodarchaeales archaeon]
MDGKKRCEWVPLDNPLYVKYHDEEWGVPVRDDRMLFEFLLLEGFQAGLSWITILRKRGNYRQAFDNFDAKKIARFDEKKIEELMRNSGIVRNRRKIDAAVVNAIAFLKVQKEFGSFNDYIWSFVNGKPVVNKWKRIGEIP